MLSGYRTFPAVIALPRLVGMLFQFVLDQLPVVVENLIANRTHPVVTLVTGQVLKANKAESLITYCFNGITFYKITSFPRHKWPPKNANIIPDRIFLHKFLYIFFTWCGLT